MLGAIWGASFMFIKVAVETIPAMPMTIIRVALSVAMMVALTVWLAERLPPWGRVWIFVGISALFGNVLPFLLIAWGEERVDGALAAILMSPSPLIAAALAHVFTSDEKLNTPKLVGIGLGICGVVVLMGLDKLDRLGEDGIRQLAIMLAGAGYAINSVANRGLHGGSAIGSVTAVLGLTLAILLVAAVLFPQSWSFTPSAASIGSILALAVFSTCVGTVLMLKLVRRQGAAFTAQVNFLVPLFGVMWGALILAERPSQRSILGLVLILGGVFVARAGSGLRPTGAK
jgi:drug/metabolite transporter (DMT)-like permease